ncbi:uncharacterized protein LOC135215829 [Macrobrachium nipponense]|uniref:uncharacterized protein LOC135215829 n=1 Tax=Macrobrachium nipponense TaxID=159736 RepID=UPI0030C82C0D
MISSRRHEVNIQVEDDTFLKQNSEFNHLGSTIAEEGGTKKAVRQKVKEAQQKWREVTGVVLDKKMPFRLKMKIYETVIWPVLFIIWGRNLGTYEERGGTVGKNRDEDGEMDCWNIITGKEGV